MMMGPCLFLLSIFPLGLLASPASPRDASKCPDGASIPCKVPWETCKYPGGIWAYFGDCSSPLVSNEKIQGNGAAVGGNPGDQIFLHNFTSYCFLENGLPSNQQAAHGFQTINSCSYDRHFPDPQYEKIAYFKGDCWKPDDWSGFVGLFTGSGQVCSSTPNKQAVTSIVMLPADFDLESAPNFRNNTPPSAASSIGTASTKRDTPRLARSRRREVVRREEKVEV